jgi:hypothetical protein
MQQRPIASREGDAGLGEDDATRCAHSAAAGRKMKDEAVDKQKRITTINALEGMLVLRN